MLMVERPPPSFSNIRLVSHCGSVLLAFRAKLYASIACEGHLLDLKRKVEVLNLLIIPQELVTGNALVSIGSNDFSIPYRPEGHIVGTPSGEILFVKKGL
jgi:hypothetical protein